MKEELIEYVMGKADQCYSDDFPINNIEIWIREFFDLYQPERSKREDCEKGIHVHTGFIGENPNEWKCDNCDAIIRRCGALNSMET
jgi:hypothetical protein